MKDYIENQLANGKYFFTKDAVLAELGLNPNQFHQQIKRLYKKRTVQLLSHGFYVIVSAEYRNYGLIPSHWIIDAYEKHLGESYYIGLLSAASIYGAAQQQPMVFQILTGHHQNVLTFSNGVRFEFHANKFINTSQVTQINTPTGHANISTKEQTVLDLLRYHKQSGYFNNVASIIRELAEELIIENLSLVVRAAPEVRVLQRAGYLFEILGYEKFAALIEKELQNRHLYRGFLRPDIPIQEGGLSERWELIINDKVDLEE